ncbi:MAG: hypothetical protein HYX24_01755 [Candidatus Aenigmarchaeota archaeon]|nr:hypothetical protein [Candidatus Aenigmarchaeota archaeon]
MDKIADSWPRSLNDSATREKCWKPGWYLEGMDDILKSMKKKSGGEKNGKI